MVNLVAVVIKENYWKEFIDQITAASDYVKTGAGNNQEDADDVEMSYLFPEISYR